MYENIHSSWPSSVVGNQGNDAEIGEGKNKQWERFVEGAEHNRSQTFAEWQDVPVVTRKNLLEKLTTV